jgi:hypothetical protein
MSAFSIYIPHVFPNFDKAYVTKVFESFGDVSKVDFVAKQDKQGKPYNSVYVHFSRWSKGFEQDVQDQKEFRVTHDDPWYWIVLPNTAKKHIPGERKPRIDLGDTKAISSSKAAPVNNLSDWITPVKKSKSSQRVCPDAPDRPSKRTTYAQAIGFMEPKPIARTLTQEFSEADIEALDDEAKMDEIEAEIEAEESNLVSIDGRYVEQLEQENLQMRQMIADLQYQAFTIQLEKDKLNESFHTFIRLMDQAGKKEN